MVKLFPVILVMFIDLTLTLCLQPSEYWDDYSLYREGSPLGRILLKAGPEYFVISSILYMIFCPVVITKLPKRLGKMVIIFLIIAHSWGASSWVGDLVNDVFLVELELWYVAVCYFIVIAAISAICLET